MGRARSRLSGKVVTTDVVYFWGDLDFSTIVDCMLTTKINLGGDNIGLVMRMRASQLDVHEKLGGQRISVEASGAGGGWTCAAVDLRCGGQVGREAGQCPRVQTSASLGQIRQAGRPSCGTILS